MSFDPTAKMYELAETLSSLLSKGLIPYLSPEGERILAILNDVPRRPIYETHDTNGKPCIARDVLMFGNSVTLACDGKCHKAWGMNSRPQLYRHVSGAYVPLTPDEQEDPRICPDENDNCYPSDSSLGDAPADPGIYEGGEPKPRTPDERLNKWCARECERSEIVERGKPITLRNFDHPVYNCEPHDRGETVG